MADDVLDVLGSLAVQITGDYSDLESSIASATSTAEAGASKIADAFNVPMGDEMVASLGSLVDQINTVGSEATTSFGELGDAATTASTDVSGLGDAASAAGASASEGAGGVTELGDAASDAGTKMEGLGESLGEIAELMGVGLGIAEGIDTIKELAVESVDAFGKLQMAETALTTFTGSAGTAADVLEKMKTLASSSVFAFPDLAVAAQKMSAVGIAASQVGDAMTAVTMAAEIMHGSVETAAGAFDRVYQTGTLTARQLVQFGITASDLGAHMTDLGLSSDSSMKQISAAFKDMGTNSSQAIQILTSTITDKLGPAFDAMKTNVPVAINQVKVAWDSMLEDFGKAAAPNLTELLGAIRSILVPIGEVATAEAALDAQQFTELVDSFKGLYDAIAATAAPLLDLKKDFDGLGLSDLNSAIIDSITHWKDVAYAVNLATIAWDDTSISINKVILAYDTWTGNASGAAAAAQRITDANISLVNALLRIAEESVPAAAGIKATGDAAGVAVDPMTGLIVATDKATTSTNSLASAHAGAAKSTQSHADAQEKLSEKLGDYLPQADAVTKAVAAILEQTQKATAAYDTDTAAYGKMLELQKDGLATQDDVDKAFQKMVTDGDAAGWSLQHITDAATLTKAAQLGLNTVIEQGHPVIVGLATDAHAAAAGHEHLSAAAKQANQDVSSLNSVIINFDGSTTTLAADLPKVTTALYDQTTAIQTATNAWNALVTAEAAADDAAFNFNGVKGPAQDLSLQNAGLGSVQAGGFVASPGLASGFVTGSPPGQGGTVGGGVGNVGLLRADGSGGYGNSPLQGAAVGGAQLNADGTYKWVALAVPAGADGSGGYGNSPLQGAAVGGAQLDAATGTGSPGGANSFNQPRSAQVVELNRDFVAPSQGAVNTYTIPVNGQITAVDEQTYYAWLDSVTGNSAAMGQVLDQSDTGQLQADLTAAGVAPSDYQNYALVSINGQQILTTSDKAAALRQAQQAGVNNTNTLINGLTTGDFGTPSTAGTASLGTAPVSTTGNATQQQQQAIANAGPNPSSGINGTPIYTLQQQSDGTYKWVATGQTFSGTALTPFAATPGSGLAGQFAGGGYSPPTGPPVLNNPGTGGFGLTAAPGNPTNPTVNINISGATVYGQGGADMLASSIMNQIRTNASLLKF